VKKNNVRFDERLELSEEFDFFMRLLITSKAVYIDKPAVIYRIHQDMSSLRLRHKHAAEVSYVLDKFREIDGRIGQKYARALGFFEASWVIGRPRRRWNKTIFCLRGRILRRIVL